jgi:hypothetical protein
MLRDPPSRVDALVFEFARSSLAWMARLTSPISSRKIVPPCAADSFPTCIVVAPVEGAALVARTARSRAARRESRPLFMLMNAGRPAGRSVDQFSDEFLPCAVSPAMRTLLEAGATRAI